MPLKNKKLPSKTDLLVNAALDLCEAVHTLTCDGLAALNELQNTASTEQLARAYLLFIRHQVSAKFYMQQMVRASKA